MFSSAVQHILTFATVTFFYPSTEWEMVQPFVCRCAAPVSNHPILLFPASAEDGQECVGVVRGGKFLSAGEVRERGGGHVSPWVAGGAREPNNGQTDGAHLALAVDSQK